MSCEKLRIYCSEGVRRAFALGEETEPFIASVRAALEFVTPEPLKLFRAGAYDVCAFRAQHMKSEQAHYYYVRERATGKSLLQAFDTGRIYPETYDFMEENGLRADVVLLDDSFSTVVRAVEFGRNVYRNLQRFILFQLTVNLSAVFFIVTMLLLGYPAPFNTLQLLWINVVMDGPPALTLGLESADESLMENKPVSRTASIVGGKMFARILLHGVYMAVVLLLQVRFNFIGASYEEQGAVIFTLFVSFQIFNAFNSRQIGKKSAFSGLKNNKLMPLTFGFTFLIHVLIVQVGYRMFAIAPLSAAVWCKTLFTAASIVLISETYKAFYRLAKGKNSTLKDKKLFKKA